MANKRVGATGSNYYVSYPAASRIACGAAVVPSSATAGSETLAAGVNTTSILGLAGNRPEGLTKGKYDGFFEQYEQVPIIDDVGYALVSPNGGNVNIDIGDFLDIGAFGSGSTYTHGVLEEQGSGAGTTFAVTCVAKALQSVTMGSKSYKIPASDVAVGDTSITMTSGEPTTMGIVVGDYIMLEDINDDLQVNMVASVSATTIGLVIPSTVTLVANDNDLVTRLYPCLVKLIK
jgi:hypothetical protein